VRTFTIPGARGGIRAADWSDGSRRLTYPEGGAFDVVVLGAGLPPGLPPVETLLKGKPIYTTYIQVGAGRDWILQFCAGPDSSAAPKRTGMVISLGDEPRMEAPYVQFAIIPMTSPADDGKHIAYYFKISAEGKVHDVRLAGGSIQRQASLTTLLGSWRFRSATRGGKPLNLEAVLIVPPGSTVE
jgi:hypothetical protein